MIEDDPLFREASPPNLEAYREAKRHARRAAPVHAAEIERDLAELDAAIGRADAASMDGRPPAAGGNAQSDDASGVWKRPR